MRLEQYMLSVMKKKRNPDHINTKRTVINDYPFRHIEKHLFGPMGMISMIRVLYQL